ncbi:MAG: UV DNA damage repair endonuclease UvsE [Oligoflexia bacterium]|nr:UV DNA damage repair endonuclease UvsE [Oligoflexia bacterium]
MEGAFVLKKIRFGLCCLFYNEPIRYRTTTATIAKRLKTSGIDHFEYLAFIALDNLLSLEQSINYCADNGIGSFRINSQFLPLSTHPEFSYTIDDLPYAEIIHSGFEDCRKLAINRNIRLTLHPDQFVVLNSPNPLVVKNSVTELEYQSVLAAMVGADVINIHAGGAYGDKTSALTRFKENFKKLSRATQKLLTVENDDKLFSPEDLLPLCKDLSIPLVYDVHHHRCHPDHLSIEEASMLAYQTWNDREPLFHISSPINGWNGDHQCSHHDYIDVNDFPAIWKEMMPLTVEVEAKAKELAIKKLLKI